MRFFLVGAVWSCALFGAGAGATVRIPDATSVLNYAERTYPHLFKGPKANQFLNPWNYRFYPDTDSYLGVNTNNDVLWRKGKGGGVYEDIQLGKTSIYGCANYPQDCVPRPKLSGDIVGRELGIPGVGWAGHIGLY